MDTPLKLGSNDPEDMLSQGIPQALLFLSQDTQPQKPVDTQFQLGSRDPYPILSQDIQEASPFSSQGILSQDVPLALPALSQDIDLTQDVLVTCQRMMQDGAEADKVPSADATMKVDRVPKRKKQNQFGGKNTYCMDALNIVEQLASFCGLPATECLLHLHCCGCMLSWNGRKKRGSQLQMGLSFSRMLCHAIGVVVRSTKTKQEGKKTCVLEEMVEMVYTFYHLCMFAMCGADGAGRGIDFFCFTKKLMCLLGDRESCQAFLLRLVYVSETTKYILEVRLKMMTLLEDVRRNPVSNDGAVGPWFGFKDYVDELFLEHSSRSDTTNAALRAVFSRLLWRSWELLKRGGGKKRAVICCLNSITSEDAKQVTRALKVDVGPTFYGSIMSMAILNNQDGNGVVATGNIVQSFRSRLQEDMKKPGEEELVVQEKQEVRSEEVQGVGAEQQQTATRHGGQEEHEVEEMDGKEEATRHGGQEEQLVVQEKQEVPSEEVQGVGAEQQQTATRHGGREEHEVEEMDGKEEATRHGGQEEHEVEQMDGEEELVEVAQKRQEVPSKEVRQKQVAPREEEEHEVDRSQESVQEKQGVWHKKMECQDLHTWHLLQAMTDTQRSKFNSVLSERNFERKIPNRFFNATVEGLKRIGGVYGRGWLNTDPIDYYFKVMAVREVNLHPDANKERRNHCFNSNFYTKLMNKGAKDNDPMKGRLKYGNVKGWARRHVRVENGIFGLEKLLFPVNESDEHWTLAETDFIQKYVTVWDSLRGDSEDVRTNIFAYLKKEFFRVFRRHMTRDEIAEWDLQRKVEPLQQRNSVDCGVYTIIHADLILRGKIITRSFREAFEEGRTGIIKRCRERLAAILLDGLEFPNELA